MGSFLELYTIPTSWFYYTTVYFLISFLILKRELVNNICPNYIKDRFFQDIFTFEGLMFSMIHVVATLLALVLASIAIQRNPAAYQFTNEIWLFVLEIELIYLGIMSVVNDIMLNFVLSEYYNDNDKYRGKFLNTVKYLKWQDIVRYSHLSVLILPVLYFVLHDKGVI